MNDFWLVLVIGIGAILVATVVAYVGLLARAVSDMSQSLRHRMDNIEHFAADVTHELKNPLASLRSALDGLDRVEDPELKSKLLAVAKHDVIRLDRSGAYPTLSMGGAGGGGQAQAAANVVRVEPRCVAKYSQPSFAIV